LQQASYLWHRRRPEARLALQTDGTKMSSRPPSIVLDLLESWKISRTLVLRPLGHGATSLYDLDKTIYILIDSLRAVCVTMISSQPDRLRQRRNAGVEPVVGNPHGCLPCLLKAGRFAYGTEIVQHFASLFGENHSMLYNRFHSLEE
jgi:hypothetical protein